MDDRTQQAIRLALESAQRHKVADAYVNAVIADIEGIIELRYQPVELIEDDTSRRYAWCYYEDDSQAIVDIEELHALTLPEIEALAGNTAFSHIHPLNNETKMAIRRLIETFGNDDECQHIVDYIYDIEEVQRIPYNPVLYYLAPSNNKMYLAHRRKKDIVLDIETLIFCPVARGQRIGILINHDGSEPNIARVRQDQLRMKGGHRDVR